MPYRGRDAVKVDELESQLALATGNIEDPSSRKQPVASECSEQEPSEMAAAATLAWGAHWNCCNALFGGCP
jgi:hypothetical protein